jgi:hypothetical protein
LQIGLNCSYKERGKRLKTVELVVEEIDWRPVRRLKPDTVVGVRVRWGELELAGRVRDAGGRWNRETRLWELRYDRAVQLELQDRIEGGI